jgi:HD-like signal output (HDOD) protein
MWNAERCHITSRHSAIGGYLLGLWGLPQPVVDATAFHNSPKLSSDDQFSMLTAVHVADVLCAQCDNDESSAKRDFDYEYLERIGCMERIGKWRELILAKETLEVLQ